MGCVFFFQAEDGIRDADVTGVQTCALPISPPPSPPPLASTVCDVEMLTTASITFSATSAMPSGPRAKAGAEISVDAAPRQAAASSGRRRWLRAVVTAVMSAFSSGVGISCHTAPERGCGASRRAHNIAALKCYLIRQKADGKPTTMPFDPD